MRRTEPGRFAGSLFLIAVVLSDDRLLAQEISPRAQAIISEKAAGAQLSRLGRRLFVTPSVSASDQTDVRREVRIPRLAASIVSLRWLGAQIDSDFELKIEQDHWIISWNQVPTGARTIEITFDTTPWLVREIKPTRPAGDGSLYLPASLAKTYGEKIRYEPQTFKNTVGYWVGKQDYADWEFATARPGTYNVCILQGSGAGQGGSTAKLSLVAASKVDERMQSLLFEVFETGHFQNFQWRYVGTLDIPASPRHTLRIEPVAIKKAALMDVRAIHLVRLPE